MRLFGTDGVRGRISEEEASDPLGRYLNERIFSKEICGELAYCASMLSGEGEILVGWDRRPFNSDKAEYIVRYLGPSNRKVTLLGEITTPALQFEMTYRQSVLGIMITASHNPSTDSGIKIIFGNGRKPTKEEEMNIESMVFQHNREVSPDYKSLYSPCDNYIHSISDRILDLKEKEGFPRNRILIDGSGGWLSRWLADLMSSHDIDCKEVSSIKSPINDNSGAGSLSKKKISWLECRESSHALLKEIVPVPSGTIIGFSFDGDGDRCYMIYSDGDSACVAGGDEFTRLFLLDYLEKGEFTVTLTIESSLDLCEKIESSGTGKVIQTGVGDRWLQHAIMKDNRGLKIGTEPSGHVVLRHSAGKETGYWGDGVVTMIEYLDLIKNLGPEWIEDISPNSGFTINRSIFPSIRDNWKPDSDASDSVIRTVSDAFSISSKKVEILDVEGEDSLLLLRVNDGKEWSIAVRNSGTEPKTRVTLRTTSDDMEKGVLLVEEIIGLLRPVLDVK